MFEQNLTDFPLQFSDHELLKSKGVAYALQRLNSTERSISRASINPHRDEPSMPHYGRDSVLFGRPTSTISNLSLPSGMTTQIENPISNLQEYCKANMLAVDIKAEICESNQPNSNQRSL